MKIALEFLFHMQCEHCNQFLTASDKYLDPGDWVYCVHCKNQSQIPQEVSIYINKPEGEPRTLEAFKEFAKPKVRRFKTGGVYKLNQEECDFYDESDDGYGNPCLGYHWAKVAYGIPEGRDYCCVDCWIVNEDGEVHPGFNVSPVPVRRESIDWSGS